MKQLILLTAILLTSIMALADDGTTTETCANGAGRVITGAVSGHKYCKSNQVMNWWNAHAWCDALGRRVFDRSNCSCGDITADCAGNKCPDLKGVRDSEYIWTATPRDSSHVYVVYLSSGLVYNDYRINYTHYSALCY